MRHPAVRLSTALLGAAALSLSACAGQPDTDPGLRSEGVETPDQADGTAEDTDVDADGQTDEGQADDGQDDDGQDEVEGEAEPTSMDPRTEAQDGITAIETAYGSSFEWMLDERCTQTEEGALADTQEFELTGSITGDADLTDLEGNAEGIAETVDRDASGALQITFQDAGTFRGTESEGALTWTLEDTEDPAFEDLEVSTC